MLAFRVGGEGDLSRIVVDAATYHDIGKLDPDNQAGLQHGRNGSLPWDHIDAGVAYLMNSQAEGAAWLVRAHHSPGLPCWAEHFAKNGRKLRGRRRGPDFALHDHQIQRTDGYLDKYLRLHNACVGSSNPEPAPAVHGLDMRLALSCLVDADHTDTAHFDTGRDIPESPGPRWKERFEKLKQYVHSLRPSGNAERDQNRSDFFEACLKSPITEPLVACEGPVGLGKTTAVTAYLLRVAMEQRPQLRRLFIVAPYTNVISQTVSRLRDALTLEGESPDEVIAEHHHRADFQNIDTRDLCVTWRAPVIVTTAVQFFETLASNEPSRLRKLHALPGSVVFLDEAHAALPTSLWRQNWYWLCQLADQWSCRFVFASGSLARFWEKEAVVGKAKRHLPELTPHELSVRVLGAEKRRISYKRLGRCSSVKHLVDAVSETPGPRLVILNTVQSAAVVARAIQIQGNGAVVHLSTALSPRDREAVLKKVERHFKCKYQDWTLVATSCVEAGVDLSFRVAFRERFSTASLIQVGGRVNRHGMFDAEGGGTVFDFLIESGEGIVAHPAAAQPAAELLRLFEDGAFNAEVIEPAGLVTLAMDREMRNRRTGRPDLLYQAEQTRDYPSVAEHGQVITANTRVVVVDPVLRARLEDRERVPFRDLLRGSVQIWATKIESLGLEPIPRRDDIFWFPHTYDPIFLGYMAGVLELKDFGQRGFVIA
jgi:CRISPR-associated endonuclease/helicase Cas3